MPGRKVFLATGEIYHIFNRGSEKRNTFLQMRDYDRFIKTFYYYQFSGNKPKFSFFNKSQLNFSKPISKEKHLEIIAYCLMPNHFHMLVKQLSDSGIAHFIQQVCNSYSKYFNIKYRRVGPLWQNRFKAVRIENDEQLMHVSRYIHLNPVVARITKDINKYSWSSYSEYLLAPMICQPAIVLDLFQNKDDYKKFVLAQIERGIELEILKHNLFDEVYDSTPGVEG